MIFEDDETLRMYVEESLEHLSNIENDLLSIEESGENINEELVNNVFRAAHSIKGGAGFMGLTKIKDISHNLENILGLVRERELVPTPDIISILLKAFDKLKDLIVSVETSNDTDVSEYITALMRITEASVSEEEKESLSRELLISHPNTKAEIDASEFDILQCDKQGKFVYLVEYDLINDIHKKNTTPLEVINSLLKSGIIINSKIDFQAVGTLDDDLPLRIPFVVLFASIIEPDMVPILVNLDQNYVHTITKEMWEAAPEFNQANKSRKKEAAPEPLWVPPAVVNTPTPEIKSEVKPEAMEVQKVIQEPVYESQRVKSAPYESQASGYQSNEDTLQQESFDDKSIEGKSALAQQTSLRVNVNLLDTLMTLAGELVLSRNQLVQSISASNTRAIETSSQRIDMITSELQETIMRTRMQPISNVFNKFNRVVRDLAKDLGKQVQLTLEGKDVELDKTIIEAINDPLTHLVRNSVDHGIESVDVRQRAGKPASGFIKLKAYHEAGQVNIEIEDDGKGIDGNEVAAAAVRKGLITEQDASSMGPKEKINLIFLPGFSTAKTITDVSGRGVGMDVVKTNLDKLGGIIDIESKAGKGTNIRIKLPLTLAIIPSQIISVGKERYAIPQVNLNELLRIPAAQVKERIEKVGTSEVVRLRGALLPLLNLTEVLGIMRTFIDPETGEEKIDRRQNLADRRSRQLLAEHDEAGEADEAARQKKRSGSDRRYRAESAINIAVVSAGSFKYGLVVDQLRDSEEIVVKPLGRHLKDCKGYAGATIMGDGKVALILDVANLAHMAELSAVNAAAAKSQEEALASEREKHDKISLLLFRNTEEEQFAVPLSIVERIERIISKEIEDVGGKKVIQYRGGSLPLYELSQVASVKKLPERKQLEVIVFKLSGKEVGLMVTPPVDAVEVAAKVDETTLKQTGIIGSSIINSRTTLMVDIFDVVRTLNPEWFAEKIAETQRIHSGRKKILFAEDSSFFRNQVQRFIEDEGYDVITAEDGEIGLRLLRENVEQIGIVLTDLEMPRMDGFEFTKIVKADPKLNHLKVVALTSLAGEEDIAKGRAAGIDDYQIKLDRDNLMNSIRQYIL